MKIASFLPSATEMLFAIGAGPEVCAVTFECDFPPAASDLPHVVFSHLPPGLTPREIDAIVSAEGAQGRSLYFVDLDRLERLAPDLVILQDLCRVCAIDSPTLARDMASLGSAPRVLSLNAHSLEEVFLEIELIGSVTGRAASAVAVTAALRRRVAHIAATPKTTALPRVLALEWLDPPFQGGHWIPEMISLAGGRPVLATAGQKSVRLRWEEILDADPDVIVVMPCGHHLAETIAQYQATAFPAGWAHLTAVRSGEVYAVDGTAYFSRPGPRLVDGLEVLHAILQHQPFRALPAASVQRLLL